MTPAERNAVLEEAIMGLLRHIGGKEFCCCQWPDGPTIKADEGEAVEAAIRALKEQEPTTAEERRLRKQGSSKWGPQFPPSSCTSWEDCVNDGDCHDPNCGAPSQNGADEEPTT